MRAAMIIIFVAAAYAPALRNGFVRWDDTLFVVENDALRSNDGLARIWSAAEMPDGFPNYPLAFTTYWLEYRLWGEWPAGYHATNIVLHAVNTGLVFALALALGASPWAATVCAGLFGLHPMQVESVAWVAERKNVLSCFFALLTVLTYIQHQASLRWRWFAASAFCFLLALLSKTAVAPLPLSLIAMDRLRSGRWRWSRLVYAASLLVMAAVAGLLTLHHENTPLTVPLAQRPLLAAMALWFYAGMLLAPWNLMVIYPRWDVSLTHLVWWLPLLAIPPAVAVIWRFARSFRIKWGTAHFALLLLPVLGFRPFGFNQFSFVADHHVYLPSVGFLLALAEELDQLRATRRRLISLVVGMVLACWLGLTEIQITTWFDSETLWRESLQRNPTPLVHNNLADVLTDQGRLDEAEQQAREALVDWPNSVSVHRNLGRIYFLAGQLAAAEEESRKALALDPTDPSLRRNLDLVLQARQHQEIDTQGNVPRDTDP